MTADLVAFLRARYDETATKARACPGNGEWTAEDIAIYGTELSPEVRAHMARHDPAHALADIDAKRRIAEGHSRPHECIELSGGGDRSVVDGKPWQLWEPRHTADDGPCHVLRCLALPYADHPDYREEWRP